ncbi:hypothetical protein HBB16_12150 [Pseudonocardia sp. MCCB 268]|nr:hypothetical protein [Pseudonocardia cytotoxica]
MRPPRWSRVRSGTTCRSWPASAGTARKPDRRHPSEIVLDGRRGGALVGLAVCGPQAAVPELPGGAALPAAARRLESDPASAEPGRARGGPGAAGTAALPGSRAVAAGRPAGRDRAVPGRDGPSTSAWRSPAAPPRSTSGRPGACRAARSCRRWPGVRPAARLGARRPWTCRTTCRRAPLGRRPGVTLPPAPPTRAASCAGAGHAAGAATATAVRADGNRRPPSPCRSCSARRLTSRRPWRSSGDRRARAGPPALHRPALSAGRGRARSTRPVQFDAPAGQAPGRTGPLSSCCSADSAQCLMLSPSARRRCASHAGQVAFPAAGSTDRHRSGARRTARGGGVKPARPRRRRPAGRPDLFIPPTGLPDTGARPLADPVPVLRRRSAEVARVIRAGHGPGRTRRTGSASAARAGTPAPRSAPGC